MEPAASIITKLGGPTKVAQHLGLHRSRVSSWRLPRERGGTDGNIPHWHQMKLLKMAAAIGIELSPSDFFPAGNFSVSEQVASAEGGAA